MTTGRINQVATWCAPACACAPAAATVVTALCRGPCPRPLPVFWWPSCAAGAVQCAVERLRTAPAALPASRTAVPSSRRFALSVPTGYLHTSIIRGVPLGRAAHTAPAVAGAARAAWLPEQNK